MDWHHFKDWLVVVTGLDMDALHVYAGVSIQLMMALILRRSLRSPLPWLVVLVAIVANEIYDLRYDVWPNRDDQWAESFKDGWNTMALPSLLLLLARFAPKLLIGPRPRAD